MNGKFILISGSAGQSCPAEKLDTASQFVRAFTGEVLRLGGGVVALAGDEESTKDESGVSHIFDWLALEEVERYARSTTESPSVRARVIMSDEAWESKIGDVNLRLLMNLEHNKAVEVHYIRRQVFTGGEYRMTMIEMADAMLAIGGGKGTYATATEMIALGKPVLPLDLKLGSISNDGDGAVDLHREMTTSPCQFFPNTHHDVINRIGSLSLDLGINDAQAVALASAEVLAREMEATPLPEQPMNANRRSVAAWQFVKALPFVSHTIRVIEWVRGLFSFI